MTASRTWLKRLGSLSPTCLEYKVVGVCYWLLCTPFGCKVKTCIQTAHPRRAPRVRKILNGSGLAPDRPLGSVMD
ncbi:hypothetical protein EKA85_06750 [Pseudomonas veronii]|nr:hypothetical protein C1Y30_22790 [Pseudomonas sp. GW704-F3]PMU94623.1 hypothetical protein C1Y28_15470 [Pseudomonas sp. GW704-F5]PMU99998.1 hypothetical protein C1Y29_23420 [Pseudomonas sp. MPBD4-3]PMV34569.1 hypothetical protein C1Y27_07155 [Pseudomonas sp. GW704-F2]RTY69222.1 hypothetical protein EKA85_06750 [Pseudomonas veronii]